MNLNQFQREAGLEPDLQGEALFQLKTEPIVGSSTVAPEASLALSSNPAVTNRRPCRLECYGTVPYTTALDWQRSRVAERRQNAALDDVLMLLEHPAVYTLGQGASAEFLKFDPAQAPWEVCRVERGGEVTYHCPGQLVGYPILNLAYHQQDLHWYLRQLETLLIQVLAVYGLAGERISGLTGVWVNGSKVAAIGIKVSRWITMHGFALNVCPDLSGFSRIVPCGIADRPVSSLAQWVPGITVAEVQQQVAIAFAEVFQVQLVSGENRMAMKPETQPSSGCS